MSYSFNTTPYDELTLADKKRFHKLQLRDNLSEIKSAFSAVLAARQELGKQRARLSNASDQYSADYIYQLLQREITTANNAYQANYNKAAAALDKAMAAVNAGHAIVDLEDPKLTNAIQVIRAAGNKLSYESAARLVNTFSGDQPALVLLQEVLRGVSDTVDGGVDKLIYNVESAFTKAAASIRDHLLSEEGSLNMAAKTVLVIAKGEGVDFPDVFDPSEVDRLTRRAAGLATGS